MNNKQRDNTFRRKKLPEERLGKFSSFKKNHLKSSAEWPVKENSSGKVK